MIFTALVIIISILSAMWATDHTLKGFMSARCATHVATYPIEELQPKLTASAFLFAVNSSGSHAVVGKF